MSDLDSQNSTTYRRKDIVDWYTAKSGMHPAEARILPRLEDELRNARLLDIGVGGGRTTGFLPSMVSTYVGIDYSPGLVDAARHRFPGLDLSCRDARDLSVYEAGSFDAVLFSFNGIDAISDPDRRQVLREIHRVLRDGGLFLFSAHNREYERLGLLPWQGRPRIGRRLLRESAIALRHTSTRRRLRKLERVAGDHVLVNDDAHGYSLLQYYIAPADQRHQLETAGFSNVEIFSQIGEPTNSDPTSVWMYYLARKG